MATRAATTPGRAAYLNPQSESAGWHDRHRKRARPHLRRVLADDQHKAMAPRPAISTWWHANDDRRTNAADHVVFSAARREGRKTVRRQSDRRPGHGNSVTFGSHLSEPRRCSHFNFRFT